MVSVLLLLAFFGVGLFMIDLSLHTPVVRAKAIALGARRGLALGAPVIVWDCSFVGANWLAQFYLDTALLVVRRGVTVRSFAVWPGYASALWEVASGSFDEDCEEVREGSDDG